MVWSSLNFGGESHNNKSVQKLSTSHNERVQSNLFAFLSLNKMTQSIENQARIDMKPIKYTDLSKVNLTNEPYHRIENIITIIKQLLVVYNQLAYSTIKYMKNEKKTTKYTTHTHTFHSGSVFISIFCKWKISYASIHTLQFIYIYALHSHVF